MQLLASAVMSKIQLWIFDKKLHEFEKLALKNKRAFITRKVKDNRKPDNNLLGQKGDKMKRKPIWILMTALLFLSCACANPLNKATFQRYRQQGFAAEAKGDLDTAEIAFYRAAENVRMGNLGQDFASDAFYNLGRIKRMVGKFDESEDLLKRALAIDEQRFGKDGITTSYTMAELALTFYEAKKYNEGVSLLNRIEPIISANKEKYTDQAKQAFKKTYLKYAEELSKHGKLKEADNFKKVSDSF